MNIITDYCGFASDEIYVCGDSVVKIVGFIDTDDISESYGPQIVVVGINYSLNHKAYNLTTISIEEFQEYYDKVDWNNCFDNLTPELCQQF